jgi:hypothetical protein
VLLVLGTQLKHAWVLSQHHLLTPPHCSAAGQQAPWFLLLLAQGVLQSRRWLALGLPSGSVPEWATLTCSPLSLPASAAHPWQLMQAAAASAGTAAAAWVLHWRQLPGLVPGCYSCPLPEHAGFHEVVAAAAARGACEACWPPEVVDLEPAPGPAAGEYQGAGPGLASPYVYACGSLLSSTHLPPLS